MGISASVHLEALISMGNEWVPWVPRFLQPFFSGKTQGRKKFSTAQWARLLTCIQGQESIPGRDFTPCPYNISSTIWNWAWVRTRNTSYKGTRQTAFGDFASIECKNRRTFAVAALTSLELSVTPVHCPAASLAAAQLRGLVGNFT